MATRTSLPERHQTTHRSIPTGKIHHRTALDDFGWRGNIQPLSQSPLVQDVRSRSTSKSGAEVTRNGD